MKIALVCAAAVALSLAACSGSSNSTTSTSTTAPDNTTATMAPAGGSMMGGGMHATQVTVAMKDENGSGESGSATLTAMSDNRVRINIGLKGENATGKQPAHVHAGTCAKPGAVKIPLTDVILGKSNTVVGGTIASLTAGNMIINVHESAKNMGKYVSCGAITK